MSRAVVYGWDIGGAHLKVARADTAGQLSEVVQVACPLWRGIHELETSMTNLWDTRAELQAQHAISMTGELCDSFTSRDDGVTKILDVVAAVLDTAKTSIYAAGGRWLSFDSVDAPARADIASANWLAMSEYVASRLDNAVVIDIGSTTTDIIPITDGIATHRGTDDATRMAYDELVYTGIVRTPLMSICGSVPIAGTVQGLAAEYFANMADVYRILGEMPPDADLHETADGADKSVAASAKRIWRMLCRDGGEPGEIEAIARYFAYRQFDTLQTALLRVLAGEPQRPRVIVAAGVGAFLVQRLAQFNKLECIEFADLFVLDGVTPTAVAASAPAAALACLAQARA